jgi:signal transduction histidine kinase/CheY-like chemotaxis protein
MSLRNKTLLVITVTISSLFLVLSLTSQALLLGRFSKLEQQDMQDDMIRVAAAIAHERDELGKLVKEWAHGTANYAFLQGGNRASSLQERLGDAPFTTLDINLMMFTDSTGRVVFRKAVSLDDGTPIPFPDSLEQHIVEERLLLAQPTRSNSVTTILLLPETPLLLAASPILTSGPAGQAQGTLFFGRFLDAHRLQHLDGATNRAIKVLPLDDSRIPPELRAAAAARQSDATATALNSPMVQPVNRETIAGYMLLPDAGVQQNLVLSVQAPRPIYQQGLRSVFYSLWLFLISGIIFCLVILLLLEKLVLSRLALLSSTITTIGKREDFSARVPLKCRNATRFDELSNLARSINDMLAALEQSKEALHQAKEAAESASRTKSRFFANMSHELRTPMNAILGFAQIMHRSRTLPEEHHESVTIINRSGEHLLTLINDVLDMSKIEAGHITLNEENFDLFCLLDDLQAMFEMRAEAKQLSLVFEHEPEVPRYVRTDQAKLRQILINLLNNAIKFTPAGGIVVTISVQPQSRQADGDTADDPHAPHSPESLPCMLHIAVKDSGIGIAPEEQVGLFQAFVQTRSGKQAHEGTGLGLSISRHFARLMGGDIGVVSAVGAGSTFSVDIPVSLTDAAEALPDHAERHAIALAPDQPRYRLLIVDDVWDNRQLLLKLLSPFGFALREASNGQEALALLDTWPPHLIWMDMRMPVMDGYEATRRIKATLACKAPVIVALTTSNLEADRARILAAGCDDIVQKPFHEHTILDMLTRHLGVRFIYEEASTASCANGQPPQHASSTELHAALRETLPTEWLQQMHLAARIGNIDQMHCLLEEIKPQHLALAEEVANLVQNFRFDQITRITMIMSPPPVLSGGADSSNGGTGVNGDHRPAAASMSVSQMADGLQNSLSEK